MFQCRRFDRSRFFWTKKLDRLNLNPNFARDFDPIRKQLIDCELGQFKNAVYPHHFKTEGSSKSTHLTFVADGIEVFATFLARNPGDLNYLSMLRLNYLPDSI